MMSDKPVRSHTNSSNRARFQNDHERKVVYRSVLDNPFIVSWYVPSCLHQTCFISNKTFVRPKVPTNLQNAIIAQTIAVLDGVAEYQIRRRAESRKRKSARDPGSCKRQRTAVPAGNDEPPVNTATEAVRMGADDVPIEENDLPNALDIPEVLRHVTLGINEVTKKLEVLAKALRRKRSQGALSTASEANLEPLSQVVLVCTADVNPPVLIDHLPNLVAACNSTRHQAGDGLTWLVPLPAGAEHTLSVAVGLRRSSVLMIDVCFCAKSHVSCF
jgi:ribonuclease P/MRP protein subunit POP3